MPINEFFTAVTQNRETNNSICQRCSLREMPYHGPVFFESEGESSKIMVISESPVGCEKVRMK